MCATATHKNVLLTKKVCRVLWFANSLALLAEISKMSIMQKAFKLYTSTSCKSTLATTHTQSIKNVTVRFLRKVYFEVGEPERREYQYTVPSILAILKL